MKNHYTAYRYRGLNFEITKDCHSHGEFQKIREIQKFREEKFQNCWCSAFSSKKRFLKSTARSSGFSKIAIIQPKPITVILRC